LQARVAESRATLNAVQPYLIAAFNRSHEDRPESCWVGSRARLPDAARSAAGIGCRSAAGMFEQLAPGASPKLERERAPLRSRSCSRVIGIPRTAFDTDASSGYQLLT
jgi:hypothetical protein